MTHFLRPVSAPLGGLILSVLMLLPALSQAIDNTDSPEGLWVTIDDNTKQPKSYVRIWSDGSKLHGKVEKILDEKESKSSCSACKGDKKNQPIQGLEIIWGMVKDGDKYDNGKILDPENGKVYSANMKLLDNGKKLEVRGYIGFSLIGRSQTWERKQEG